MSLAKKEPRLRPELNESRRAFVEIISADVDSLMTLARGQASTDPIGVYTRALLAYLTGDAPELERLDKVIGDVARKESTSEWTWCSKIVALRTKIRTRQLTAADLEKFTLDPQKGSEESFVLWNAEALFVKAMGFANLEDHLAAKEAFGRAASAFHKIGATKKYLKSLCNQISAEGCARPEKRLLQEYHHLYLQARDAGDRFTAALAAQNISREYQLIGSLLPALKYSERSLALLRRDHGHLNYYLALLQRADVLMDLGRLRDAQMDLELSRAAEFPEIKSAVSVLQVKMNSRPATRVVPADLPPPWRERLDQADSGNSVQRAKVQLSQLEQTLIHVLAKGPIALGELCAAVYPEDGSTQAALGRLKTALSRLRKKRPGEITFSSGKYYLNEIDEALRENK